MIGTFKSAMMVGAVLALTAAPALAQSMDLTPLVPDGNKMVQTIDPLHILTPAPAPAPAPAPMVKHHRHHHHHMAAKKMAGKKKMMGNGAAKKG